MTKRFYIEYDKNAYKCVCDNGKLICGVENLVDLLNNLYEENRNLRKLLNIGRTNAKDILDVLNEQEKYKIENQELKEENNQLYQKIFEK